MPSKHTLTKAERLELGAEAATINKALLAEEKAKKEHADKHNELINSMCAQVDAKLKLIDDGYRMEPDPVLEFSEHES